MMRSAEFSDCATYRHRLDRWWADGARALICMTNPSKAGSVEDDPTVNRCVTLISALGYPGLTVVNWEPYIATDPKELYEWRQINDCYGEVHRGNLALIRELTAAAAVRILAWGNLVPLCPSRLETIEALSLNHKHPLFAFGKTKDGNPKHPMARGKNRIANGIPLELWLPGVTCPSEMMSHA